MRSVKVADYMTRQLVTFTPDTPLYEAMSKMLERRFSGAPVVNRDGDLVGVLSEIDFLDAMLKGAYHGDVEGTVGEVMTHGAEAIDAETDIYEATRIFIENRRRRLPVTRDGRLVGQISRRDVLRAVKDWIERQ
ncbi:MAG: CBS domain-containing protein [Pseudomonadales bacterium]|jgi:CBS domain-containing protein|nr:CBS domain-containing protein [Pseudomonadales bacterium]